MEIEPGLLRVGRWGFVPFEAVGDSVDVNVDAYPCVSGVSGAKKK